jgi:demethoxyubiquinone hydroxylase (CLK1/Coq7/Cat5 family)
MGYAAGKIGGDAQSLGFVAETERQVEQHLA